MYQLHLSNTAEKDLDKLEGDTWRRVKAALEGLLQNPRPAGCRKLQGEKNLYRVRVGNHRLVYDIDDAGTSILVLRVKHRSEVYRDL